MLNTECSLCLWSFICLVRRNKIIKLNHTGFIGFASVLSLLVYLVGSKSIIELLRAAVNKFTKFVVIFENE